METHGRKGGETGEGTERISLYCRILDNRRPDPVVKDVMAIEIARSLDYDFTKLKIPRITVVSTALRVKKFDQAVLAFHAGQPEGTVVSIGCGLETRSLRLDNGTAEWYDLDLPAVIKERRKYLQESERHHFLGVSALDPDWMDKIREQVPARILFLAEGVFMYFPEQAVRSLMVSLQRRFPGSQLIFDVCSRFIAANSRRHPALKGAGATVKWGLKKGREIERWNPGIRLLEEWNYFDRPDPVLGWYRLFRFFPAVNHMFRILHFRLEGERKEKPSS